MDTQGGVLGATKTDKDADAYNERTKAEYHDLSNLKTKPSYPEGTVEKGGDLETVKNLAYEEGKKKGKLDGDNGAFGTSNQSSTNFSSNSNPVEEKEIHQENKSAYNPGGVSAVFEENTTGPQATKSNAKSGSSGNTAAGDRKWNAAAGAGLAGVAASSGNSKQSQTTSHHQKVSMTFLMHKEKIFQETKLITQAIKTPVPDWDPRILLLVRRHI